MTVQIIEQRAHTAPGYPACSEHYVYASGKLVQVCPSRSMAESVAAGVVS